MSKQTSSFERFCSFDAFYDASYKVCRNVRWKDSTINFEENRIETILKTEADLRANEYWQLVFSCFSIIERGKPRDIRACHINDRLVQNSLCEEYLLPELTPKFIYDNCATLKGKGIDFALERVKHHLQQAHRDYGLGNSFHGLRIDIRKYFDSIDHKALKKIAKKVIKDKRVYKLVCYLIDTLNEIDHFIKEELHIKYYGRYMDDLYLLHEDSKYLAYCKVRIQEKLAEIGLTMNTDKTTITKIEPIKKGGTRKGHTPFKYLKQNFYLTETNGIIQTPFKEKISHQRRKLRKMAALWRAGKITDEDVQTSYQGWRAHMKKGDCHYIIQDMDNYFRSLFKGVEIR